MNILALDLSLRSTGVAASWAPSQPVTLRTTKLRGMERLVTLGGSIEMMLERGVAVVVLEGYSFGSKGRAVFDIGELGGVIKLMLHKWDIPFAVVAPTTLKKYATGKGNAPKDAVLVQAVRRFGLELGNDEADAWWLLQMGMAHYDQAEALTMPKVNREALEKVEWPKV
jgi:crossover junction endodeoxyribonuclease RuvC